jgi:hypothetical protein
VVYILMPYFSKSRNLSFSFDFIPYLTGRIVVSDFQPRSIRTDSKSMIMLWLTNIRRLPWPFSTPSIQFTIGNLTKPVSYVLSSNTSVTVISISVTGSFRSTSNINFSVFDAERGINSASKDVIVQVVSLPAPAITSVYPQTVPSFESNSLSVIISHAHVEMIETVDTYLIGETESEGYVAVAAVHSNISSIYSIDSERVGVHLRHAPCVSAGNLIFTFRQGTTPLANFSITVVSRELPLVEHVSPSAVKVSTNAQQVSVYLKSFPTASCGTYGSCFEQALSLRASCKSRLARVLDHVEIGGLLTLTIEPPPLTTAGVAQCFINAFDSTGRAVTAHFSIGYEGVYTASPVDGLTQGGGTVTVTAVGLGLSDVTEAAQLDVSFCGVLGTVLRVNYDVVATSIAAIVQPPAMAQAGACEGRLSVKQPATFGSFPFVYFDRPTASASPMRASQDGATGLGYGGGSTKLLVRGFPRIESVENVLVIFGALECDGTICRVLNVVNYDSVTVIEVSVPACPGCGRVDIMVTYKGTETAPAEFHHLTNLTFAKKRASAPFVYFQSTFAVASVFYCDICHSPYCVQNGACGDARLPQVGSAPSGGLGRLTLHVDGAYARARSALDVSEWEASVVFDGSVLCPFRVAYDVDGSRIALECSLPDTPLVGSVAGVLYLRPGASALPCKALFAVNFAAADQQILCLSPTGAPVACRIFTGVQPLRVLVTGLPLRVGVALTDASEDLMLALDGRSVVVRAVTSYNGSAAAITLTTPYLLGPARVVNLEVGLSSRPGAAAIVAIALQVPPAIASAAFAASLTAIDVAFDVPTDRCAEDACSNNCTCLLAFASAARLGSCASCVWGSDSDLAILLGAGATIAPGDPLAFAPCLVGADGVRPASLLSTVVAAPALVVAPNVRIDGPSAVDVCSGLEAVATADSPREVVYSWGCANDAALDAALRSVTGSRLILPAGAPELAFAGKTYVIRARATDFIGSRSAWATLAVLRLARPAPRIQFEAPVVLVRQGEDAVLVARAIFSACPTPRAPLIFTWSQAAGPPLPASTGLSAVSLPQIVIPGEVLRAGSTYRFAVRAASRDDPAGVAFGECAVTVLNRPLVAKIAGGTALERTSGAELTLDASASSDLDSEGEDGRGTVGLEFEWTCAVARARCRMTNGSKLALAAVPVLVNSRPGSRSASTAFFV